MDNILFIFNLIALCFISFVSHYDTDNSLDMHCVHNNYVYILSAIVMQDFHISVPSGGIMGYP